MRKFLGKLIRKISIELYLQIKSFFYKSRPLDTDYFLNHWESRYNGIMDPSIEEILSRLIIIRNSMNSQYYDGKNMIKNGPILEIGAGYGRITKKLIKNFDVISIEPNKILFIKLLKINPNSII